MKVIELFDQLNNLNPESVVYAKRIDGAFTKDSEVVILELTEEEMEWKIAKVIPIHKGGSRDDMSNYRPISILPITSKILERSVHEQLLKYLEEN